MRLYILILFLLAMAGQPATAQEARISAADCRNLVRHQPQADATFTPGVDGRGRRVAPADVGGPSPVRVPDSFSTPITVDLGDRLGIPPGGDADFTATAQIGLIDVTPDGQAFFNGQPLQSDAAHELSVLCQRLAGPGRVEMDSVERIP